MRNSEVHLTKISQKRWRVLFRIEAQFLREHRPAMLLALAGLALQTALALPAPVLQGRIVDRVASELKAIHQPLQSGLPTNGPASRPAVMFAVGLMLIAMIGCHGARGLLSYCVSTTMSRITLDVVRQLTNALHHKLQRLNMSYFDREPTGHIMARVTSDVGSLLIFLSGGSLQLLSDVILAVGISLFMFWIEWRLAICALLTLPLFLLNHIAFSKKIHALAIAMRNEVSQLYALLSERVPALRVIRIFGMEDIELAEFNSRLEAQQFLGWNIMRTASFQSALSTFIQGAGIVTVLAGGALLIEQQILTAGELLAFFVLVFQLYQPIVRLAGAQSMLAATVVAVERIFEVLDEPDASSAGVPRAQSRRSSGRMAYRDVSFGYRHGGPRALDRITLDLDPGMTLGLMGPSGSGKTTLLALAPRIYELSEGDGAIVLDSRDIRDLHPVDLRRSIALVPQQAFLFGGTVRSNLTYAAPDASGKAIGLALEMTGLRSWVETLPAGIDTKVGERGQSLSGGQRQRLALARALIADPAILLLDDCTSALDAETEAQIHGALYEYRIDRTCVIVSHKVASVRDADRIIVIDGGRIVEDGTHASLIRGDGYYSQTYHQQTMVLSSYSHNQR
jgi:ABC-type multidrug transport system fused ATPase/permease subunit